MTTTPDDSSEVIERPEVLATLRRYREELASGLRPNRTETLSRHPDIADDLAGCLDTLEFLEVATATRSIGTFASDWDRIELPAQFGDYRLLRIVGQGGMGAVYEAEQVSLRRQVAVKTLPFASALDDRQLQRFRNETHAIAQLRHPNIVRILSVGFERGVHYFAMEWVEGRTLASVIRDTQTATSTHLRLVVEQIVRAAHAIGHANDVGVIHRDIKPSNLMADANGDVRVMDFGLAHVGNLSRITRTGDFLGTLRYASPEQVLGGGAIVDHRTDVYSLGSTLYELITLRPAREGDDHREVLRKVASEQLIAPRKLNPLIPPDLETITLKAMATDREERYVSASEFAADLEHFLAGRSITARPPSTVVRIRRWSRRHTTALISAAVSAIMLLLGTVIVLAFSNAAIQREREQADEARQEAIKSLRTAREAVYHLLTRMGDERLAFVPQMEKMRRDMLEEALRLYETLEELREEDTALRLDVATSYGRLGRIDLKLGRIPEAERSLRKAISLMELLSTSELGEEGRVQFVYCYMHLGWLLRPQIDPTRDGVEIRRKAVAVAEQLANDFPDTIKHRLLFAETLIDLGNAFRISRPEEAEQLFIRAISLLDTIEEKFQAAGRAGNALGELRSQQRRWSDAIASYERAAEIYESLAMKSPQNWQMRERLGDSRVLLGRAFAAIGRTGDALKSFRQGIELFDKLHRDYPSFPENQDGLAMAWAGMLRFGEIGDFPAGVPELVMKLELFDERAISVVAWSFANAHEPSLRDPDRALAIARNGIEKAPQSAGCWRAMGVAQYRLGEFREAVIALEKAVALDADDAPAWMLLAGAHRRLSNHPDARRCFARALDCVGKDHPESSLFERFRLEVTMIPGPELR